MKLRQEWVIAAHAALLQDFDRFRKTAMKINTSLLRHKALGLVQHASFPNILFHPQMMRPIFPYVTDRWVQSFLQQHNILVRIQSGKLSFSPNKQQMIDQEISSHLDKLTRDYDAGVPCEENVDNADETHFEIDMNYCRTFAMHRDE